MDILDRYCHAVTKALEAVSNGCDASKEAERLKSLESELRAYFTALGRRPDPIKAAMIYSERTAAARSVQRFILSYSGGGTEQVVGWEALAKRIGLTQASIRVYLSKGKGMFSLARHNPLTEQPDMLTVARVNERGEAIRSPRGRPRTKLREEDFGTHLAESAKTMPKTRNRRRSEKSESS